MRSGIRQHAASLKTCCTAVNFKLSAALYCFTLTDKALSGL